MHRQPLITAIVCLITAPIANADAPASEFSLSLVNTSDEVRFDIASDLSGTETPNVLSELIWDDMEVWSLEADADFGIGKAFRIGLSAGLSAIVDGKASDQDFLGDNRTMIFSSATATVDGKHRMYGDVNIGWRFENSFAIPLFRVEDGTKRAAFASAFSITPRIGYNYQRQEITFTDGVQLVPDMGAFEGLNSSYTPEWQGLYVGVDGSFRIYERFHVLYSAQYYPDLSLSADGSWNLRADLAHPLSFRHSGDGTGFDLEAGLEWAIDRDKAISLSYRHTEFDVSDGTDQVFSVDFGDLYTRLNNASWVSYGWLLQMRWRFGD